MADPPENLLLFTPHIPRRAHATGWTAERQRAFIAALARTGVVRAAAESVEMSARSAYQLRARAAARANCLIDAAVARDDLAVLGPSYTYSFAAAWDLALGHGLRLQLEAAVPVCLEGEEVPVIRRGRIVGWRRKFNDTLAISAVSAWRRYTEGPGYDHELRTAERTLRLAEAIELHQRVGPATWPDPAPPESDEDRRARERRAREEERIYGPRVHGLLDPGGPADRPPRTLAERAALRWGPRLPPRQPRIRAL